MADNSNRLIRADLITGIVLLLFGMVVFYLSWTMPRLESRGIHVSTIPGLVPMILGGMLAFCGALLAFRAWRQGANFRMRPEGGWSSLLLNDETRRLVVMIVLTLSYALILVGRLPFWLATMLYLFSSIVVFERYLNSAPKPLVRCLILAGVQSVLVAVIVTYAFQEGFLVRLP